MAIQNRRGVYTDFDVSKMVAGEIAVVQSGDPSNTDGKAIYIAFQNGSVARLVLASEMGSLSSLETTAKTSIVDAINELTEKSSILYGSTTTAGADRDKVVVCEDFVRTDGALIIVSFSQTNTVNNARLNINGTGVCNIYNSQNANADTSWLKKGYYLFRYYSTNGGRYTLVGALERIPSDDAPLMDGTASAGTSNKYSRGDHVHPKDTSKADVTALQAEADARAAKDTELDGKISDVKADLNDLESDGVVASAEQLLSDKYTVDQVPYHYRASGSNGADREYDEIVGGTINWNQLCPNKAYTNTNTDTRDYLSLRFAYGTNYTLIGNVNTAGTVNVIVASTYTATVSLRHSGGTQDFNLANNNISLVAGHKYFVHLDVLSANPTVVNGVSTDNQMVHDLTTMFGTAVADYIYNLEQSSAGAGVALFRQLIKDGYHEFNEGTLMSVSGLQSHDMVGFNQWDGTMVNGYTSNSTGELVGTTYGRSTDYIRVFPNTGYYVYTSRPTGMWGAWYDENKTFISGISGYNRIITSPINARYCRMTLKRNEASEALPDEFCFNISNTAKNGTYEPYEKHSYPLDNTVTLRGIPQLVDGQLKFDGDTYSADGAVTRRYGIVDLGTLTWSYGNNYFRTSGLNNLIERPKNTTIVPNVICDKYVAKDWRSSGDKEILVNTSTTGGGILIKDSTYTDAASFKAAMSGVYLVYELATPTTETAEPYAEVQKVDPYGTEEYVTTSIVPVGHYTKYPENLRAKIENLDLSMIAPIETGTTASQAYAVGKYFLLNNKFCKAKTAIASGATFTLNTNYEVTTIADELYTALH